MFGAVEKSCKMHYDTSYPKDYTCNGNKFPKEASITALSGSKTIVFSPSAVYLKRIWKYLKSLN